MYSSAQAWPLHLTVSCYLRLPPVNLIALPLLALSVHNVCKTDEGRVSIVWSMKSNTKESNYVSAVKLLGLMRGWMLLAPCFPPVLHSWVHWLCPCWSERDDSCSGASSVLLEIKFAIQRAKSKHLNKSSVRSGRSLGCSKCPHLPKKDAFRLLSLPKLQHWTALPPEKVYWHVEKLKASPTLAYPDWLLVKLSFILQNGKPVSLGY